MILYKLQQQTRKNGKNMQLPEEHIACSGEMTKMAFCHTARRREQLYALKKDSSLIDKFL